MGRRGNGSAALVNCAAATAREADGCFLLCGMCAVPALHFGLAAADSKLSAELCAPPAAADPEAAGSGGGLSQTQVDAVANGILAVRTV